MRYQMFGYSFVLAALVACGGDDDGGKVVVPDAKVFMDAAIDAPAACALPASVPGGTLGSANMRQSGPWIRTMNNITFFGVTIPIDQSMVNTVTFVAIKQGANWQMNTAINFDPNPTNQTPAALAFMDENLNSQTGASDRTLWATNGSITFTEIGQTAGNPITFNTTATNYREINDQGADVPGGCTSMTGAITAYLTQMNTVAFVPPGDETPAVWRDVVVNRVMQHLGQ